MLNKSLFIDFEVVGTGSVESLSLDFTKEAVNLLPIKTKISLNGSLGGIVLDVKTLDDLVAQLTSGAITIGLMIVEGDQPTYEVTFEEGSSDLLLGKSLFEINLLYTLKTGEIPEVLVPYYLDALEAKITREAIAVLIHSTLKVLDRLPEVAGDKSVNDYLDAKIISSWAKSSMDAMTT